MNGSTMMPQVVRNGRGRPTPLTRLTTNEAAGTLGARAMDEPDADVGWLPQIIQRSR
jgi:hypothetical protein